MDKADYNTLSAFKPTLETNEVSQPRKIYVIIGPRLDPLTS